jgi:hypothetical protein
MAYWLISSRTASHAAVLSSAGQEKSGKPWARLMASYCRDSRVISRITDSVKRSARDEWVEKKSFRGCAANDLPEPVFADFIGSMVGVKRNIMRGCDFFRVSGIRFSVSILLVLGN